MTYDTVFQEYPTLIGYVVLWDGGVDMSVRAASKAAWIEAAVSQNLIEETDEGTSVVAGANIDEIGAVVLDLGDPEIGISPVLDYRHHVNIRVAEPLFSKTDENGEFLWVKTALAWVLAGTVDTDSNASETGKKVSNVTLLDQSTISSPSRDWA